VQLPIFLAIPPIFLAIPPINEKVKKSHSKASGLDLKVQ